MSRHTAPRQRSRWPWRWKAAAAAILIAAAGAAGFASLAGGGPGSVTAQGSGDCRWCGYYARFSHGLPASRSFFPIAIWDQYTASTSSSSSWGFSSHYPDLASAATAMGINTFVGQYGWPSAYGVDAGSSGSGFLQSSCNVGAYVIAGGDPGAIVLRGSVRKQVLSAGQGANDIAGTFTLTVGGHTTSGIPYDASAAMIQSAVNTAAGAGTVTASGGPLPGSVDLAFASASAGDSVNYSGITDTASIASVKAIAGRERSSRTGRSCLRYLAGYQFGDEPPPCAVDVPADVAAMHAMDPTRLAYEGMASWVTGGDSGCPSTADANFAGSDIPASDDYHDTDAYSAGACAEAHAVRTSPWTDCSWLYGYQAAIQVALAGSKPTWEDFETGNDVFGFAEMNNSACRTSANICTVSGQPPHEYNATAPQVNANVWGALINGAAGIIWFCDGTAGVGAANNTSNGGAASSNPGSYSDCLGGSGNSYSSAEFANLRYIDHTVDTYAAELNTVSTGACTMQPSAYSTIDEPLATQCSDGDLTISTGSADEPIQGMTKSYGGSEYLFVMADRANGQTNGTYTISGRTGQTATLIYDSAARYDPSISEQGRTFVLNTAGQFSDSLAGDDGHGSNGYGAGANSYEVKIYRIS